MCGTLRLASTYFWWPFTTITLILIIIIIIQIQLQTEIHFPCLIDAEWLYFAGNGDCGEPVWFSLPCFFQVSIYMCVFAIHYRMYGPYSRIFNDDYLFIRILFTEAYIEVNRQGGETGARRWCK